MIKTLSSSENNKIKNLFIYPLFVLSILVTLASCSPPTSTTTSEETSASPSTDLVSTSPKTTKVNSSHLISPQGIGDARLGMTYGELKKSLGSEVKFEVKSPFMVDFDAISVNKDGNTQYHIIYPANTTFSDSDVITTIITDNPDYRTDKGIGVGTTIKDAQAAYGEATLAYSTANESRESVSFANQPKNIAFRPSTSPNNFAGIYKSQQGEYNQTKEFRDDAAIKSVQVYCIPSSEAIKDLRCGVVTQGKTSK
ncbi:hypothetical protein [Mastigocoleus testarum]|uniref:hypothetical protein n=1 Tax=Mastigocoleus testarum TaxID=996925 RepID=UPI0004283686|nr:hypothetical protein [Mastigocoleus testarum]